MGRGADFRVAALCWHPPHSSCAPPPPSLFLHPRAQNFKWEMIGEVVAAPGGGTMEAAQKVRPGGGHHGSCAEGATGGGGTMEAAAKPG